MGNHVLHGRESHRIFNCIDILVCISACFSHLQAPMQSPWWRLKQSVIIRHRCSHPDGDWSSQSSSGTDAVTLMETEACSSFPGHRCSHPQSTPFPEPTYIKKNRKCCKVVGPWAVVPRLLCGREKNEHTHLFIVMLELRPISVSLLEGPVLCSSWGSYEAIYVKQHWVQSAIPCLELWHLCVVVFSWNGRTLKLFLQVNWALSEGLVSMVLSCWTMCVMSLSWMY